MARPSDPAIRATRRTSGGFGREGYALFYALYYTLEDAARLAALSVGGQQNRFLTLSSMQIVASANQFCILHGRWNDDVTLHLLLHFFIDQVLVLRNSLCGNCRHAA